MSFVSVQAALMIDEQNYARQREAEIMAEIKSKCKYKSYMSKESYENYMKRLHNKWKNKSAW